MVSCHHTGVQALLLSKGQYGSKYSVNGIQPFSYSAATAMCEQQPWHATSLSGGGAAQVPNILLAIYSPGLGKPECLPPWQLRLDCACTYRCLKQFLSKCINLTASSHLQLAVAGNPQLQPGCPTLWQCAMCWSHSGAWRLCDSLARTRQLSVLFTRCKKKPQ